MIAEQPIVRMMRLQQTLCGYVKADGEPMEDLPGLNPRLECLRGVLESFEGPFVIWSRFKRDVDKIHELCCEMGFAVANYDGRTGPEDRTKARQGFQVGTIDVFNGNPAAASKGITLTRPRTVVYFTNSFRYGHRAQSEDRTHRGIMDHSVNYIDIACPGTIDMHIIRNLRSKIDVAAQVTGDRLREWLASE